MRNNLAADFEQWFRYGARVSIQPESIQLKAAGEMNLPDILKRNVREKRFDGLAAIELIAIDVV